MFKYKTGRHNLIVGKKDTGKTAIAIEACLDFYANRNDRMVYYFTNKLTENLIEARIASNYYKLNLKDINKINGVYDVDIPDNITVIDGIDDLAQIKDFLEEEVKFHEGKSVMVIIDEINGLRNFMSEDYFSRIKRINLEIKDICENLIKSGITTTFIATFNDLNIASTSLDDIIDGSDSSKEYGEICELEFHQKGDDFVVLKRTQTNKFVIETSFSTEEYFWLDFDSMSTHKGFKHTPVF